MWDEEDGGRWWEEEEEEEEEEGPLQQDHVDVSKLNGSIKLVACRCFGTAGTST